MRLRSLIVLLVVAALAAGGLYWRLGRGEEVRLQPVGRGTAAEIVYATGVVEPVRWAKMASMVRERIVEHCACEGQPVKAGAMLVRLDDREVRANLAEQQARLALATRELERVTALLQRGVSTQQASDKATSDLAQIRALVSATTERLANYTILAPRDGIVLRQDGEVGEVADVGQILFRVGDPRPLQVTAEVAEEDIPRVIAGQTVLLRTDAFRDRRLAGTVREITPMGDTATKTFRIRIALPDDTPLHFGMSVEANIVTREAEAALLVPNEGLVGGAVFTVEQGRLVRRPVQTGIRGTRMTQVLSGLAEGDLIAVPAEARWRGGERARVAP
ncbi:efflux RND transporter periplasmic adaptor subunit [Phreatobacter sp.]|uniref:efflux RND transporter periplasmic adaptor subunit n=1 Tax=Phreatobacter sp. TaxID=1966341 RepID=UPI003F713274